MPLTKLLRVEWHVVACAIAALVAMILHLLGLASDEVVSSVMLLLIAMLLLRIQNHSELLDHLVELARHAANVFESGHELALRPEDLLRSRVQGPIPAATRDGRPAAY